MITFALMMAQDWTETTWETINYGRYINKKYVYNVQLNMYQKEILGTHTHTHTHIYIYSMDV